MTIVYFSARAVSFISFGALWISQIYQWEQWWGALGLYLGIGAIPVGLTLPIVYFIKTGFFSYVLFGLLAVFIASLVVGALTEDN